MIIFDLSYVTEVYTGHLHLGKNMMKESVFLIRFKWIHRLKI